MVIYNKPDCIDDQEERKEKKTCNDTTPQHPNTADNNLSSSSPLQQPYSRVQHDPSYYLPDESSDPDQHQKEQSTKVGYKFKPSRGIIGNSIGFVSHELSKTSSKNTNDASKSVVDSVTKFFDGRLNKKDMKSKKRLEKRAHRHDDHTEESNIQQQEPQQPQQQYIYVQQPYVEHPQPFDQQPYVQPAYVEHPYTHQPDIHTQQPYVQQPYLSQPFRRQHPSTIDDTLKVGKSERSDVLIANAWHHRSDAYSSFVALIAIGGTYMGIPIFDPLGGIVVSCMVLKSGTDTMRQSTRELTDQSFGSFELEDIKSVIMNVKDKDRDIIDFVSLRGRKFGPFYHVDFTLNVNKDLTIKRVNEIEKKVKFAIQDKYKIMIHVGSDK